MHESNLVQIQTLVAKAHSYLSKYDSVQVKLPIRSVGSERWLPSKGSWLKINFDTTFNATQRRSCMGLVVRDCSGAVKGSHSLVHNHVPTSFTVEALECLSVIRLAVDLGLQHVIIEEECLFVIHKVSASPRDPSTIGPYI